MWWGGTARPGFKFLFVLIIACLLLRVEEAVEAGNVPATMLQLSDWLALAEWTGILSITHYFTTLVQTEAAFTAAYSPYFKIQLLKALRAEKMDIVDLRKISTTAKLGPKLPMVSKSVHVFSLLGKASVARAKLEAERRFCGNKTEQINDAPVVVSPAEWVATFLDPRFRNKKLHGLITEAALVDLFVEAYVAFEETAWTFDEAVNKKSSEAKLKESALLKMTATAAAAEAAQRAYAALAATGATAAAAAAADVGVAAFAPSPKKARPNPFGEDLFDLMADQADDDEVYTGALDADMDPALAREKRLDDFQIKARVVAKNWLDFPVR